MFGVFCFNIKKVIRRAPPPGLNRITFPLSFICASNLKTTCVLFLAVFWHQWQKQEIQDCGSTMVDPRWRKDDWRSKMTVRKWCNFYLIMSCCIRQKKHFFIRAIYPPSFIAVRFDTLGIANVGWGRQKNIVLNRVK